MSDHECSYCGVDRGSAQACPAPGCGEPLCGYACFWDHVQTHFTEKESLAENHERLLRDIGRLFEKLSFRDWVNDDGKLAIDVFATAWRIDHHRGDS